MEWYILKSGAILAALLLFYKLLLEKENMHTSSASTCFLPWWLRLGSHLLPLPLYVEPTAGNFDPMLFHYSEEVSVAESKSFSDYLPHVLWAIYAWESFSSVLNL
jgi:bla regulator protein blaR1